MNGHDCEEPRTELGSCLPVASLAPGAECGGLHRILSIEGVKPRRETQRQVIRGRNSASKLPFWASLRTLWIVCLLPSRRSAVVLDLPVIRVEAGETVDAGGGLSLPRHRNRGAWPQHPQVDAISGDRRPPVIKIERT